MSEPSSNPTLLEGLLPTLHKDLNAGQIRALELLGGEGNVFITGGAGTGKTYVLRKFLRGLDTVKFPILASTGAAAVMIGGRTFHSFFGLGILEGGVAATIERATKDRRVTRRLKKLKGFVVDEVSMIPGQVLDAAERIASIARGDPRPWGGLKVVAVGDFAQLPPITRSGPRDWAFLCDSWQRTEFQSLMLKEMMRSQSEDFTRILNDVREGSVTPRLRELLEWRSIMPTDEEFEGSILYAKKVDVDRINMARLARLPGEARVFETEYSGDDRYRTAIMANAPVPQKLELKKGALVMIRQNDPQGRWVNGSLGHVKTISSNELEIHLLGGGIADVERTRFSMLDAEGNELAAARNFPVNLAYAITIHKAQGATLDKVIVSLRDLWEPGHAYVALSRVRHSDNLMIDGWDARSIIADPRVKEFHRRLEIADDLSAEGSSLFD